MSSDEIVKLAKKEGLEEQLSLPKQQLVFEVLRGLREKDLLAQRVVGALRRGQRRVAGRRRGG